MSENYEEPIYTPGPDSVISAEPTYVLGTNTVKFRTSDAQPEDPDQNTGSTICNDIHVNIADGFLVQTIKNYFGSSNDARTLTIISKDTETGGGGGIVINKVSGYVGESDAQVGVGTNVDAGNDTGNDAENDADNDEDSDEDSDATLKLGTQYNDLVVIKGSSVNVGVPLQADNIEVGTLTANKILSDSEVKFAELSVGTLYAAQATMKNAHVKKNLEVGSQISAGSLLISSGTISMGTGEIQISTGAIQLDFGTIQLGTVNPTIISSTSLTINDLVVNGINVGETLQGQQTTQMQIGTESIEIGSGLIKIGPEAISVGTLYPVTVDPHSINVGSGTIQVSTGTIQVGTGNSTLICSTSLKTRTGLFDTIELSSGLIKIGPDAITVGTLNPVVVNQHSVKVGSANPVTISSNAITVKSGGVYIGASSSSQIKLASNSISVPSGTIQVGSGNSTLISSTSLKTGSGSFDTLFVNGVNIEEALNSNQSENIQIGSDSIEVGSGLIKIGPDAITVGTLNPVVVNPHAVKVGSGTVEVTTGTVKVGSTNPVTISSNAITVKSGGVYIGASSSNQIKLASNSISVPSGTINVSSGTINVSSGTIQVSSGTIQVGTGNSTLIGSTSIKTGSGSFDSLYVDGINVKEALTSSSSEGGTVINSDSIEVGSGLIKIGPDAITVGTLNPVVVNPHAVKVGSGTVEVTTGTVKVGSTNPVTISSNSINVSSGTINVSSGAINVSTGAINVSSGAINVGTYTAIGSTTLKTGTGTFDALIVDGINVKEALTSSSSEGGTVINSDSIEVGSGLIKIGPDAITVGTLNPVVVNPHAVKVGSGTVEVTTGTVKVGSTNPVTISSNSINVSSGAINVGTYTAIGTSTFKTGTGTFDALIVDGINVKEALTSSSSEGGTVINSDSIEVGSGLIKIGPDAITVGTLNPVVINPHAVKVGSGTVEVTTGTVKVGSTNPVTISSNSINVSSGTIQVSSGTIQVGSGNSTLIGSTSIKTGSGSFDSLFVDGINVKEALTSSSSEGGTVINSDSIEVGSGLIKIGPDAITVGTLNPVIVNPHAVKVGSGTVEVTTGTVKVGSTNPVTISSNSINIGTYTAIGSTTLKTGTGTFDALIVDGMNVKEALTSSGGSGDGSGWTGDPIKIWGQTFNGSADITGSLTNVASITMTGNINCDGTFNGNVNANQATIGTGTVNNISGDTLSYTSGQFTNLIADYLESNEITTEYLTVTKQAHFFELIIDKIKAAGGAVILSPADGFKVDQVEDTGSYKRLWWKATDGDKKRKNMWEVNDQAICMTFNAAEGTNYDVSNKYYWALVRAAGNGTKGGEEYNYIDLDPTVCDGTLNPEVGDEIAMLGSRGTDVTRQSAIYLSAYASLDKTLTAPLFCHYKGINDFKLENHKYTWFAANGNTIRGNLYVESGESVEDIAASEANAAYLHIAYANSSDGLLDFSKTYNGHSYMGTCSNHTASDETLQYTDYQWVKIKGEAGVDAPWIEITGDFVFKYGANYTGTPNDVNLTATLHGISGTVTWTSGDEELGTGTAITLHDSDLSWHGGKTVSVKASCSGCEDSVTVYQVADGAAGAAGITLVLSNETFTLQGNSAGQPIASQSVTCAVQAYQGTSRISATYTVCEAVEGNPVEVTPQGNPSLNLQLTFTTNENTSATGSMNLYFIVNGLQFQKTITWGTASKGEPGPAGPDAAVYKLSPIKEHLSVGKTGNLTANLQYSMLKIEGENVTVLTPADGYKLLIKYYLASSSTPFYDTGLTSSDQQVQFYLQLIWQANYHNLANKITEVFAYLVPSDDSTEANALDSRSIRVIFDAAATLEITDSIQTTVQGHSTSLDTLTNSVSTLTQKADSITARVDALETSDASQSESISELRLDADGLTSSVTRLGAYNLLPSGYFDSTTANSEIGCDKYSYTIESTTTSATALHSAGYEDSVGDVMLSLNLRRSREDISVKIEVLRRDLPQESSGVPQAPGVAVYDQAEWVERPGTVWNVSEIEATEETEENEETEEIEETEESDNWITYQSVTILQTDDSDYFDRPIRFPIATGTPGSSQFQIKITFTSSSSSWTANMNNVIMAPYNATASLIEQTADRIMMAVNDVSLQINSQEIVLDGDTRIEGNLNVTDSNTGFSILGPNGEITQIKPTDLGTYSSFRATSETAQTVSGSSRKTLTNENQTGTTAGGVICTYEVNSTVTHKLGSYSAGQAITVGDISGSVSFYHPGCPNGSSYPIDSMHGVTFTMTEVVFTLGYTKDITIKTIYESTK